MNVQNSQGGEQLVGSCTVDRNPLQPRRLTVNRRLKRLLSTSDRHTINGSHAKRRCRRGTWAKRSKRKTSRVAPSQDKVSNGLVESV